MARRQILTLRGPVRDGRGPSLRLREPEQTRAVVLVMHGGKVASDQAARWRHLNVVRMQPFARDIARGRRGEGVAVCSLLFSRRGWNETGAPIADALWALDQIQARYGPVPVVLLGHSMGGRTAVRVAGHPSVVGVVGLAPWLPAGEPTAQLDGRVLTIIHGTSDVWVPIKLSRAFVAELADTAVQVELIALRATGHTMLRRARTWQALAVTEVHRMVAESLSRLGAGAA